MNEMTLTIFAKKRQSREGRPFTAYLTTLSKKDGTSDTMSVKFKGDDVPKPEECPMVITIDRDSANISTRNYTDEMTGEIGVSKTLWVSTWKYQCAYVDHTMDDYI